MQLLPESGKNLRDFIQVRAEALQAANDSWYLDGISQGQGVIKMAFGVSVNHMNHHVSIWAGTLQWLHDVGISDFSWNASTEGIYTKEASLTPMTRKKSQADSFKRNKIYIYIHRCKVSTMSSYFASYFVYKSLRTPGIKHFCLWTLLEQAEHQLHPQTLRGI